MMADILKLHHDKRLFVALIAPVFLLTAFITGFNGLESAFHFIGVTWQWWGLVTVMAWLLLMKTA